MIAAAYQCTPLSLSMAATATLAKAPMAQVMQNFAQPKQNALKPVSWDDALKAVVEKV